MRRPSWRNVTAMIALAAVTTACVVWRDRLGADLWPPDSSRIAPNIVAGIVQWAVILIVVALIWPPTRRRLERAAHRFADRKLEAVHAGIATLREHHARHHADMQALREELQAHRAYDTARHAEHAAKLDQLLEAQNGQADETAGEGAPDGAGG